MIKHVSILVKGKVQGVFFRASTKEKADEIGVNGFVRNQLNGDVYIEAEADEMQLTEFISWSKHGPRKANVESCLVEEGKVVGFTEFKIQR
jgi:acylphosphatase